jgi:hypothetical protein
MENMFGGLFKFDNQKEFDEFTFNMDKLSALKIIELSILVNQQNGIYSLQESYCLYKCISKLKETYEEDNLHHDDNHGDID